MPKVAATVTIETPAKTTRIGLTKKGFEAFKKALAKVFQGNRDRLFKTIPKLAKCGSAQLQEVQKLFKQNGFTIDHFKRLVAHARGEMAKHLAAPEQSIRHQTFQGLSEEDRDRLNDPKATFEVVSKGGYPHEKRSTEMTREDWDLLIQSRGGKKEILTVAQQASAFKKKKVSREFRAVEGRRLNDNVVVLTLNNGDKVNVDLSIWKTALRRK